MRTYLDFYEFAVLKQRMNDLHDIAVSSDYPDTLNEFAHCELSGITFALETIGFAIERDAHGKVIDITPND